MNGDGFGVGGSASSVSWSGSTSIFAKAGTIRYTTRNWEVNRAFSRLSRLSGDIDPPFGLVVLISFLGVEQRQFDSSR